MASSVQAFRVTITNGSGGGAPADGFIDHLKIEQYGLNLNTTPMGLDLNACKAKRRGNVRYLEMINQLQMVANCYVDPNSYTSDATESAEANTYVFHLYAERGADSFVTADELSPGDTLTGDDCIKRCIGRALIADLFKQIDVVDPTSATTFGVKGSGTSVVRFGVRIYLADDFEIGSYAPDLATAEAQIAVLAI